ncbi:hypothetical protein AAG570_010494 [Ranatra chinensis]|uniref:Uncharacterized protein n=1 Tax=Ranatra chinensis TaxID=642074 RepID=A0ABD0ZB15_9HEMI
MKDRQCGTRKHTKEATTSQIINVMMRWWFLPQCQRWRSIDFCGYEDAPSCMYPKDLPRNRTSPITEKQGRWRRQFVQEYLSGHRIGTKQSGDDYFAEMKPLLYSLKLLGRFPYRIGKQGVIPLKGVSWGVVYTLFAYLVQAAWTANTGRIICSVMSKPKINYDDTLFWFSSIVFLTLNLCVPFSYWLDAPSVNLFRHLDAFFSMSDCG